MLRQEDSEEIEIDLDESNDSDEVDEPHLLWKAPLVPEDEENIHTSTLVEISDTKPLLNCRDPRGINECLKVLIFYAITLLLRSHFIFRVPLAACKDIINL